MRQPLAVLSVLLPLLSGCLGDQPTEDLVADAGTAQPPLLRAHEPVVFQSRDLTGDFAVEIAFQPTAGECTTEFLAAWRGPAEGTHVLTRRLTPDGRPVSMASGVGTSAWFNAGGVESTEVVGDEEGYGGFYPSVLDVQDGLVVQYYAADLAYFENPFTYGQAVWLRVVCSQDTVYSLRAARETLLAGAEDFYTFVGASVPAAAGAATSGALRRTFSTSAEWSYFGGQPSIDLTVVDAVTVTHFTEFGWGEPREPLPPGPYEFGLELVDAPHSFVLLVAAFQPVPDLYAAERLPAW